MKSVFAIVCSATPELRNIKFYATQELARKQLKKLADERRFKLGVDIIRETDDKFTYLFGWEEHRISFAIIELQVEGE